MEGGNDSKEYWPALFHSCTKVQLYNFVNVLRMIDFMQCLFPWIVIHLFDDFNMRRNDVF